MPESNKEKLKRLLAELSSCVETIGEDDQDMKANSKLAHDLKAKYSKYFVSTPTEDVGEVSGEAYGQEDDE